MTKPKPVHAYTFLPYKDDYVDIDVNLANLMQTLWEKGIDSNSCCQDLIPGTIYEK